MLNQLKVDQRKMKKNKKHKLFTNYVENVETFEKKIL